MNILFLNLHWQSFIDHIFQTQCINNLENVLVAAGSSWEKVVKVNVYLKDMEDFSAMNEVYEKVRMEDVLFPKKATISPYEK